MLPAYVAKHWEHHVPPLNVSQSHRKCHGSIGYNLGLPISDRSVVNMGVSYTVSEINAPCGFRGWKSRPNAFPGL